MNPDQQQLRTRSQELLLGCAVGDTLGLPAERLSPQRKQRFWGTAWRYHFAVDRGRSNLRNGNSFGACLLLVCLLVLAACTKQAAIPPSNRPTYSLHGSGAPLLTNGQVLTGLVRFAVRPIITDRWHTVDLRIDEELIGDFVFQANTNTVAVFDIDTSKFKPGEHKIILNGEMDSPQYCVN